MQTNPLPADSLTFDHTYLALDDAGIQLLVGDPDRVFRLASVTKPMAAWSVLVAVSRGIVALEDPAGPQGATIEHLLAHASGVLPDPGAPIAKPGRSRIYSNYGYDLLGEAVANRVGMPIQRWVSEAVFQPLGMTTATLEGSIAKDARASLDDVAKFAQEMLSPTLITPALYDRATAVAYPGISGVVPGYGKHRDNTWGLGPEIKGQKSPHWLGADFSPDTFGHYGRSGSFIYVDPQVRQAGAFLGEVDWGEDHAAVWPELTNQMRGLSTPASFDRV